MIIAKIISWVEKTGKARAAAELHRMGYHKEAKALITNQ